MATSTEAWLTSVYLTTCAMGGWDGNCGVESLVSFSKTNLLLVRVILPESLEVEIGQMCIGIIKLTAETVNKSVEAKPFWIAISLIEYAYNYKHHQSFSCLHSAILI